MCVHTALVQTQWAPLSVVFVYSSALSPENLCLRVLQVHPVLWLPLACYSQGGANISTMCIMYSWRYTRTSLLGTHWDQINLERVENNWKYSRTSLLGTVWDQIQLGTRREPLEVGTYTRTSLLGTVREQSQLGACRTPLEVQ